MAVLVCVGTGIGVVAQEDTKAATARGSQAGSVVTVSGCLLQMSSGGSTAGASDAGATTPSSEAVNQPSTASATGEERFVLANAKPANEEGRRDAERFLVTGLSRDDLRKHINHQVELSGRVEELRQADAPREPEPEKGKVRSAAAQIGDLPQLNATSLRMIADACVPPVRP